MTTTTSATTTQRPADEAPPRYPMRRGCPFDPPAELGRLREERPVTRVSLWDGSTPWLVTRYDDVRTVLADRRFSADSSRPGYPPNSPGILVSRRQTPSFIAMDDPEHARYRRMLISDFAVRRTETLRPAIERMVDELLDTMAAGPRPVDLVEAFALPLPSMVICQLLGVPYSDHDLFQRLSRTLLDTRVTAEDAECNNLELRDYLRTLVAAKQADPGDDLVSRLVERIHSGELDRDEVVAMARLLLVAGHETTANMIGLGVLTLLRHPEQAAELRDMRDPAAVSAAVEELLRLLTVVHTGRRRVATEDVELAGTLIRAGEGVIAAGESANRDPARFADPDRLDIHRSTNHHVAFGFGIHQCLGQPLARLELQIAYPALLRRFPDLRVAADLDDLPFRDEMVVYGVHALPVTW